MQHSMKEGKKCSNKSRLWVQKLNGSALELTNINRIGCL